MSSIDHSLLNYKPITKDGLIKKKIIKEGFGACPKQGMQIFINIYGETEDSHCILNSLAFDAPKIMILGHLEEHPGIDIAIHSMKMGETSTFFISPEYTFFSQEKHKNSKNNDLNKPEDYFTELPPNSPKNKEDIQKMDLEEAKKYQNVFYEIELIKFDKVRPSKYGLNPEEIHGQVLDLKSEGNELFKSKRFMEAIVKYKDARDYLNHVPFELTKDEEYQALQHSLTLNISNCHINLSQYNYALKNLEEFYVIPNNPKAIYFKSLCQMHLGDFDSSYNNLLELKKVMNDEKQMQIFMDDFNRFKNETINKQKNLAKKGMFGSNLYEDKKIKKRIGLPRFDPQKNTCFYFDFLFNNDSMNPQKIKFELFDGMNKDNENNPTLNQIYQMIIEKVKENKLNNKNINFNFDENNNIILMENIMDENINFNNFFELYKDSLPFTENVLLLLNREKLDNNKSVFSIEISTKRVEDNERENYIILGRCFYNHQSLLILYKKHMKGILNIIASDISKNPY